MLKVDIPIPSLKYVNVYSIKNEDKILLIDTGWNDERSFNSLISNFNSINLKLNQVKGIIITHFHMDHLGLSLILEERSRAPVYIHEKDRDYIRNILKDVDTSIASFKDALKKVGAPSDILNNLERFSWIRWIKFFEKFYEIVIGIKDNEIIKFGNFELELLWTPGHTPGHICVYDKSSRILFSGDHILPTISSNISTFDFKINPLQQYIDSLGKVSSLEVDNILPAHENNFLDLKNRIKELKIHHYKRLLEIIDAIKRGKSTPYEISSHISWKLGGKRWNDADAFQRYMALGETISHLIFLKSKGIIKEEENTDSIKYYINNDIKEKDIENIVGSLF